MSSIRKLVTTCGRLSQTARCLSAQPWHKPNTIQHPHWSRSLPPASLQAAAFICFLARPAFFPAPASARPRQPNPRGRKMAASATSNLELEVVDIDNPGDKYNFILGHSHFIKTVEDLYEALVQSGTALKFGIAFCEASGDRKVRFDGNSEELTALAKQNAMKLGAGHTFIVFLDQGFPVSVLNAIKAVPEVCHIHCATQNPTAVIVAKMGEERKGILGVIDGFCPTDYENDQDKKQRHHFLRMIGYKR